MAVKCHQSVAKPLSVYDIRYWNTGNRNKEIPNFTYYLSTKTTL